jgi:hypothetical protein
VLIEKDVYLQQQKLSYKAKILGSKSKEVQELQSECIFNLNFRLVAVKRVCSYLNQISKFEHFLLKSDRIKLLLVNELKNLRELVISFDKRSFFSSKMQIHLKLWDLSFIKDLCTQSLTKLILEPVLEVTADIHNFGFRQNRSAHQALALLYKQFKSLAGSEDFGILMGGSNKRINPAIFSWLLGNLPIPAQYIFLLHNWYRLGLLCFCFFDTSNIMQQLNIIAPLLLNFLLDGLQQHIINTLFQRYRLIYIKFAIHK